MAADRRGVRVRVEDGAVTYPEGDKIDVTNLGELLVLDAAGAVVARFDVGNWRSVDVLHHLPPD